MPLTTYTRSGQKVHSARLPGSGTYVITLGSGAIRLLLERK
jgi:hypothetical protein